MSSLASRRHLLLGALALPLLHLPVSIAQASNMVTVGNAADLDRALANATANTTIVLRNGTYQKSGTFEIRRDGNSSGPIRIVAQNHLGATIRAQYLLLSGVHVHVSGLRFDNSRVIINRDNCRLSNCSFSGSNGRASVDGAANVVINNNEFRGWGDRCIAFNPLTNGAGKNPHIHRNYFRDSGNVAIAVGFQEAHQMLRVGALIERNMFVNCSHDQVVNLKSSNNRVRQNTMVGSGAFVCRLGIDNSFENNWIEDSLGIWLSDRNCSALGNRLSNSDILVLAGNITSDQARNQNGGHPRAEAARVFDNVARRTTVGVAWNGFNLPAINTVVDRHNGRVDRSREQGTQIGATNNGSAGNGASRLQASDVGPVASNVSVPAEQPTASNPSPAPTEPTPPSQTPTPPSDTAATPPATNPSTPTLDTSSFSRFTQGSSQPGSDRLTLSRQPIFSQSSTPTPTSASRQFNLPGSLFGTR
jgi:hypothetical protein